MSDEIFGLIILPAFIFFARIVDVSLQTLRIIFTSRGKIKISPIVGFFEVFIWLLAVGQIFQNVTNLFYYFAYAAGFATGNYIGIYLERKISIGLLSIRLILKKDPEKLLKALKEDGYGLTVLSAEGTTGINKLVVIIIKRRNLSEVTAIIEKNYPNAFLSVEEVQSVKGGVFPQRYIVHSQDLRRTRKSK